MFRERERERDTQRHAGAECVKRFRELCLLSRGSGNTETTCGGTEKGTNKLRFLSWVFQPHEGKSRFMSYLCLLIIIKNPCDDRDVERAG